MSLPFDYDQQSLGEFGGTTPTTTDFDGARVVILPIPLDRTTSYVPGTRNGPHEILVASSHMELWDEETGPDVHRIRIYTLPERAFPLSTMDEVVREIGRVTAELVTRDKFVVALGGEHAITDRSSPPTRRSFPALGPPARRPRRPARHLYGHAAQSRVRDAPRRRVRPGDAGRDPQSVDGRSEGSAVAADDDFLRLQHAAGSELDRPRRRFAERHGLHHDRRRRLRSRDHAGHRHTRAGRADVARGAGAAAHGDREADGRRL